MSALEENELNKLYRIIDATMNTLHDELKKEGSKVMIASSLYSEKSNCKEIIYNTEN